MAGSSRDRTLFYECSETGALAAPAARARQHSGSIARAGGRPINPLAVLASIRATLHDYGDARFDADTFVVAYGRARGRAVTVHNVSLAGRGLLAETWVCETCDIIRVDRQVPPDQRNMVILVQWANIHYSAAAEAVEPFDVLAEAVARHQALPSRSAADPVVY